MRILKDNLAKVMQPYIKFKDGRWCMKPTKVDEAIDAIINAYEGEGCVGIITDDFGQVFFVIYAADINRLRKVQEYYIGVTIPHSKVDTGKKNIKEKEVVDMSDVNKPIKGDNFVILKNIGQISAPEKGWKKELNLVQWHGKEAKYDIRDWAPDYSRCGKGGTFTEEELKGLYTILKELFESEDANNTDAVIEKCALEDLYKKWDEISIHAPEAIKPYLKSSRVDSLPGDRAIVSLKKGYYDQLAKEENRKIITAFISNIVDKPVHVELVESSLL